MCDRPGRIATARSLDFPFVTCAPQVIFRLHPLVLSLTGTTLNSSSPRDATTILVVDDERVSRRLASRIFSEQGYRLLEADGAVEALNVLSQAQGRVDLVVLDVVMPGCNGVELGRRVQQL